MKARITDIKPMAIHDGPGIRTTVFLKGCSLRCLWCHNPETLSGKPQLAWYENKCMSCMGCAQVCPTGAHRLAEGSHRFDREVCTACGKCVEACPTNALQLFGTEMTVEQLLPRLLEDRPFYETTGGGVTISGGECLLQADFCAALLQQLKAQGIHTAVDTCGCVSREAFEKVLPYTDLFLYDLKAMDPQVHKACTGQENGQLLENLRYLDSLGAAIEIRIPFVPGHNEDQMAAIGEFLQTLQTKPKVKLLAYHNFAGSKYHALGLPCTLPEQLPTEAQLKKARQQLKI